MRVKNLAEPVEVEPPRSGEDAADCVACNTPDDAYIWVSERWRVRGMDRPTGLPMVLILECRSHLDIGDLPNLLAAELGVMTVRLERAIRSLDSVARVHVNRWGDGSAHLHMWFLARPYGRLQLRGTFLSLWDDLLPVIPEEQWRENLALVAEWLAGFGGRAIAEPPHIHWQSPSTFGSEPPSAPDTTPATGAEPPASSTGPTPDRSPADPLRPSDITAANAETRNLSSYATRTANPTDAATAEPARNNTPTPDAGSATPDPKPSPAPIPENPSAISPETAKAEDTPPSDASGTGTAPPTASTPVPHATAASDSPGHPTTAAPHPAPSVSPTIPEQYRPDSAKPANKTPGKGEDEVEVEAESAESPVRGGLATANQSTTPAAPTN
ncbi:hypothetical protein [Actinoplanes nipponensis]|uniref:Diadenosine tetraphosphate (Ap4A) hydrolase n=2 Tax=Actinoplanes nipponensis TaxID=135950 RepID=A0A919JEY7_9ACTN|nr:hypothetical protein Ani05nite_33030 [Actinoplanes nipponensis]